MAATGFHTADELNALLPGHAARACSGSRSPRTSPAGWRRRSTSGPSCSRPTATCTPPPWSGLADTACGLATRALLPDGASRLHHDRAEDELPRHRARGPDRHRRHQRARRAHDAGLGRRRDQRRHREDRRPVPLHPVGALAALNARAVTPVWRGTRGCETGATPEPRRSHRGPGQPVSRCRDPGPVRTASSSWPPGGTGRTRRR